jgi:hypothetical protein
MDQPENGAVFVKVSGREVLRPLTSVLVDHKTCVRERVKHGINATQSGYVIVESGRRGRNIRVDRTESG